jgi:hypothetical protein
VGKQGTLGQEEAAQHTDPVPATGPEGRGAHEGEQKEGLMPKDRSPSKEIPCRHLGHCHVVYLTAFFLVHCILCEPCVLWKVEGCRPRNHWRRVLVGV